MKQDEINEADKLLIFMQARVNGEKILKKSDIPPSTGLPFPALLLAPFLFSREILNLALTSKSILQDTLKSQDFRSAFLLLEKNYFEFSADNLVLLPNHWLFSFLLRCESQD